MWPLLAALPIALLALAGGWVLCRFLAVRDHLGRWTLTMRDDHGTILGQGPMVLTAEHWSLHGAWSYPWVDVDATMSAGPLPLTAAGRLAIAPNGLPPATLTVSTSGGGGEYGIIVLTCAGVAGDGIVAVDWRTGRGKATFYGLDAHGLRGTLVFPVELTR
jgi:hypothetical protein